MDFITINGYSIPYPNDFEMKKVPNRVAEIQTLTGKTVADINGWKYDDCTLKWDTLIESDLQNLLAAIRDYDFMMSFNDIDGAHTVEAILASRVNTKTRFKVNGNILWRDITVTLTFPECYE